MRKLEELRRVDDGDPFNAGWNACLDEALRALKPERDIMVAVEGDNLDQIKDGCMAVARAIPAKPRSQTARYLRGLRMKEREKMKRNRENREVLRRAFNLIRNDPAQKSVVNNFAKALGGNSDLADDLLASAHQIIAAHQ